MRQRNEQALVESSKRLEQALDHDPKYAAAWSALAIVLNLLPIYASGKPEKTFESAEKAARRAMELDPAMAEPLTLLASLNEMRGDWVEADRLYEKALALDPEDPASQFWHATSLSQAGSLVELDRICSVPWPWIRGTAHCIAGSVCSTVRLVNLSQLSRRWPRARNWAPQLSRILFAA